MTLAANKRTIFRGIPGDRRERRARSGAAARPKVEVTAAKPAEPRPVPPPAPAEKKPLFPEVMTGAFEIDPAGKILEIAETKFGKAAIFKNVAFFDHGYIGFFAEAKDQASALERALGGARANKSLLGERREIISTEKAGLNKIMIVYKRAK